MVHFDTDSKKHIDDYAKAYENRCKRALENNFFEYTLHNIICTNCEQPYDFRVFDRFYKPVKTDNKPEIDVMQLNITSGICDRCIEPHYKKMVKAGIDGSIAAFERMKRYFL